MSDNTQSEALWTFDLQKGLQRLPDKYKAEVQICKAGETRYGKGEIEITEDSVHLRYKKFMGKKQEVTLRRSDIEKAEFRNRELPIEIVDLSFFWDQSWTALELVMKGGECYTLYVGRPGNLPVGKAEPYMEKFMTIYLMLNEDTVQVQDESEGARAEERVSPARGALDARALMKLNIGCGNNFDGDLRIDVKPTKAINMIADAHFLPFRESVFSDVMCTEVIEHLDSPLQALSEMKYVMNNDGIILITVPNLTEIRRVLSINKNPYKIRNKKTRHKQGWDAVEFQHLTRMIGLKVEEISWIDWYGRKTRREKYKFLNLILKHVLPKNLYHTHMKVVCKNIAEVDE